MKKIIIEGPSKINGFLKLQGSKNSMLINLALPLLTDEECIISNVPRIADIELNLSILQDLGGKVRWLNNHTVSIKWDEISKAEIDPNLAIKTSSSKFFIPLLVKRLGQIFSGPSLGDDIGLDRGFSKFINLMHDFGILFEKSGNGYIFYLDNTRKPIEEISLSFPSFSATVGAVLANVLGNSRIKIHNIHLAPEIENAFQMLTAMGAKIKTEDSSIEVEGVERLHRVNFENLSDRNALVTFTAVSLITSGSISIKSSTPLRFLKLEAFWDFLDRMGAKYKKDENGLTVSPSTNLRPTDVYAYMWPNFHSDWQPLIAPLLTQISGESSIVDDLFEKRFGYWDELGKMGAKYDLFRPINSRFKDDKFHGVKIFGPTKLQGAEVRAPDLRGGASLIIAGLVADGRTTIENVEQIERGYEDIVEVLSGLGASISYEH